MVSVLQKKKSLHKYDYLYSVLTRDQQSVLLIGTGFLVIVAAVSTKAMPTPITIITGFLGSGKTTLILNLIPQLPKTYKLALLKNEFGDVAIDSQLASSAAISGVQELLNGCICCNLVGQLGDALDTLRKDVAPDRIIIETSGSAFPATLAMEVNRLGLDSGYYVLDGVIVVIDVENWKGYDDTSYTAKLQARYTDLVVFNKWENVSERKYEDCLDRLGDLELQVANVKSQKGYVDQSLLLGLDSALAKTTAIRLPAKTYKHHDDHDHSHQSEVEVLSVTLSASQEHMPQEVNLEKLEKLLVSAPRDEIYRIKALFRASHPPGNMNDSNEVSIAPDSAFNYYILNWAFGRWNFTPLNMPTQENDRGMVLRMTIVLARGEAERWKFRIEAGGLVESLDDRKTNLRVEKKA